jgi:Zinc-finger double-stranded RNA-binding
MAQDSPYKCVTCNGKIFKTREELDKHTSEEHATSKL